MPIGSKRIGTDIVDPLDDYSPERLRHVASYAEDLTEYRERAARLAEGEEEDKVEERSKDLPNDVPSKATIMIKEINDNRYYYWQWREGDRMVVFRYADSMRS